MRTKMLGLEAPPPRGVGRASLRVTVKPRPNITPDVLEALAPRDPVAARRRVGQMVVARIEELVATLQADRKGLVKSPTGREITIETRNYGWQVELTGKTWEALFPGTNAAVEADIGLVENAIVAALKQMNGGDRFARFAVQAVNAPHLDRAQLYIELHSKPKA